ncbi:hypothetical protein [Methylibium petroleiphilum]|uniref:Uncharacterized protein n=1 Tax=Methylibium petroleiphilum (strain ATCC BAA-1232 / LMG 22953 / PM1) TaxID=420662 RepID=A2SMT4_METPP|nr:hypothetical protein [Methylibium petroleiphilum]ABM96873.1 hypothetical protein Mpe_B0094 [Methylibium petroleiphilum PM1]
MNGLNAFSPIEIGLDALGVSSPEGMLQQLGVEGVYGDDMVKRVTKRVEETLIDHPEIRSEIVAAGLYILLGEVDDIEQVRSVVLPRMDLAVDRALVAA